MKTIDTLKICFHNIFRNKARTFITIVIVFIVSVLLMTISCFGISLLKSLNKNYVEMYDMEGAIFTLGPYQNMDGDNFEWRSVTCEEYNIVINEFEKYPEIFDNIVIYTQNVMSALLFDFTDNPSPGDLAEVRNSYRYKYADSELSVGCFSGWGDLDVNSAGVSYLKTGHLWNKDDEGSKKIWVSEAFIAAAANKGKYIKAGDSVVLAFSNVWDSEGNYVLKTAKFVIAGIFINSALRELKIKNDIFINVITLCNVLGDSLNINGIKIINEPRVRYDFDTEYKKMEMVVHNINLAIEPSINNKDTSERFRCGIVDVLSGMRIGGFAAIGAVVFVSFIVLIISIGGVANSIIISVDKNRRFIGVMMAVGLNKRGVKRLIQYEALISILVATGAAYGVLRLSADYIKILVDGIMKSVGANAGFESVISMPYYIPAISIISFIAMALLFARGSLTKIVNMDVVSVISEVA